MITATGLGSGLDITGLVDQLVSAERAGPDLQLNRQSSRYSAKFSALGSLKGALSSFQSSLTNLNSVNNFGKNTATSSDSAKVSATASASAIPNQYAIEVSQLATSHSLASAAVADADTTTLGTGSITFSFGTTDYVEGTDTYNSFDLNADKSSVTIDITSGNNTLEGIMAAINAEDFGVSASIVNDGTGFRLLLRSEDTGGENSMAISVTDDDLDNTDASGLSLFAFNSSATNMGQTAAASDAQFTINGLSVSSATNSTTTAIPGVNLTLKEETTSPLNITVAQDTNAVVSAMNSFISGYNGFVTTANNLSAYDAENNIPSALVGDFTLRSVEGQVDNILRSAVSGLSGSVTTLSELGVTTSATGTLSLDSAKFLEVLKEYPEDVKHMFTAFATSGDEDVSFKSASSATVVGSYAVEISTLASSGAFTGSGELPDFAMGGSVTIDSDNDNFTIEVDGVDAGEITLAAGTYSSGAALAEEIQAKINGSEALREVGKTVSVSYDSGSDSFTITSDTIGSTSTVNMLAVDTNSAAQLGFSAISGVDGVDVAGTIGGIAATGAGNVLAAAAETDAEGLNLIIDGGALGSRGDVNFTRGIASQFDELLEAILAEESALNSRIDSYQDRIDDVADRREELELRWEAVRERYTAQFNALDTLLGQLESTSSYLQSQLDNLLKPNTGQSS